MSSTPPIPPSAVHFDRYDAIALLALTVIAFVLRFYSPLSPEVFLHPTSGPWLTNCVSSTPIDAKGTLGTLCGLAYPFQAGSPAGNGSYSPANGQVFDEVYFPVDAYHDFKGLQECAPTTKGCPDNYFDPEPPLGKTLIGAGEMTWGWYRAHILSQSGNILDLGFNTFGWRLAACLFGILCIPLIYLLSRRLYPPRFFALAAATLLCFDGMAFIQSRIGMIDIFVIFFILLSYYLFLVHLQSKTILTSHLSLLALGGALGLAVSTKWIGLAAASVIFFLFFLEILRAYWPFLDRQLWPHMRATRLPGGANWVFYLPAVVISLVLLPVVIYVASWYPFFARGQFHDLAELIGYNRASFLYHATLTATHPFGSPWWSWPFLSRPVYYYAQGNLGFDAWTLQPLIAKLYNIGNPWIWWTSLPCLVALLYFMFRHRSFPATLITLGFITQFAPWSQVTRVTFLYHMFAGAIFMLLALAFVLTWIYEHRGSIGHAFSITHLALAVVVFAYFYPIWAAVPIGASASNFGPNSPPWGAKTWFAHCVPNVTPQKPQLWCWP